jgi:hypothetical protein
MRGARCWAAAPTKEVQINRDANLLPASEAILLPADTNSLDAKSPTVFSVIRFTILAIVSNIPPPPTT